MIFFLSIYMKINHVKTQVKRDGKEQNRENKGNRCRSEY